MPQPPRRRPAPAARAALAAAVALAAWLPLPGAAQVVRCTNPVTGAVTYTDGACRGGEGAREVQPRMTPQEIQQEREQAAEALERKNERQQLEASQRREAERAQQAERSARRAPPAAHDDPARSPECLRARQNLQAVLATLGRGMYDEQARHDAAQRQADLACLSPAEFARTESARAHQPAPVYVPYPVPRYGAPPIGAPRPPPPPRREITQCNVFRCYDAQGNTYPR